MKVSGEITCQGAVFIYKNDGTQDEAWRAASQIDAEHGGIRRELHSDKNAFLAGLREWNEQVDPGNAFLCIYAHMGNPGLNCVGAVDSNAVTWSELADALSAGVEYLWLVGCSSSACLSAWTPLAHPVRHLLLATSDSRLWLPLLKCFAAEISIDNIVMDGDMPDKLEKMEPELAKHTEYFLSGKNGLTRAFQ